MTSLLDYEETKYGRADVIVDDVNQGSCFINLRINYLDPNESAIRLYDTPDIDLAYDRRLKTPDDYDSLEVFVKPHNNSDEIHIRGSALISLEDRDITVEQVDQSRRFADGDPYCASFEYRFPLSGMVYDFGKKVRSPDAGVFRGERRSDGLYEDDVREISVATPVGEALLSEKYLIREVGKRSLYPKIEVARQSACCFPGVQVDASLQEIVQNVRHEAERLTSLVGFVEKTMMRWQREIVISYVGKEQQHGRFDRTRWATPPHDKYQPSIIGTATKRRVFKIVSKKYYSLKNSEKRKLDDCLLNYSLATRAKTLETKLQSWVSCLQYITEKVLDYDQDKLSRHLLAAFESEDIRVDDLIDKDEIEFINKRHDFIHRGLDSLLGKGSSVHEAWTTVRALVERLILRRLNAWTEVKDIPNSKTGFRSPVA
jgi:hypothetical protein